MGAKESKTFPITSEEAAKRVSEAERRRLNDAFRRLQLSNGSLSKSGFLRDVLGDGIPSGLAEKIFTVCGGGGNHVKGLHFREVLTVLVLITRGSREEKIKFLFGLLSPDSNAYVERSELIRFHREWDAHFQESQVTSLFIEGDRVNFENFSKWIDTHPTAFGLAEWLLSPDHHLSLVNRLDTPTFYQTLAGVTHLEEQEIVELEKRFWNLAGNSNSGQINLDIVSPLVSPPLPQVLVSSFFSAFDENQDGHIDFKELSCGVSAACRGPAMERQKFCFKIFDTDRDGVLNYSEIAIMVECMNQVRNQVLNEDSKLKIDANEVTKDILEKHDPQKTGALTMEEFLVWTVNNPLPAEFSKLIFQLCHIVLGLRPISRSDEGEIVQGWLDRETSVSYSVGSIWHLINMEWWTHWKTYVNHQDSPRLNCGSRSNINSLGNSASDLVTSMSSKRTGGGKKTPSLDSTLAMDGNSGVVGTSYQQLSEKSTPEGSKSSSRSESPQMQINHRKTSSSVSTNSSNNGGAGNSLTPQVTRPGIIDNSSLVQTMPYKVTSLTVEGGKLKPSSKIKEHRDFELIPERLWKALVLWYGGLIALPRQVIRNKEGEVELELNPLSVKLFKHQAVSRPSTAVGGGIPGVIGGYSAAAAANSASVINSSPYYGGSSAASSTSVNAAMPTSTRRYHAFQSAFSRRTTVKQIADFLSSRLHLKHEDVRLWHFRDESNLILLEDETRALEDLGVKDEGSILVEVRSRDGTWPEEITSLCNVENNNRRSSSLFNSSLVASTPGITGLNNLGNTCYLNAAVQCVSNTKILAQYFKRNCHLFELNRTNPLGMKGHVAKRFGDLVRDMWTSDTKTIAPIKLRWTIGRYRPHFAGFQQQDAQELLSFLLDGLHEDLNRVTDKPYVELKDSLGRSDVIVAAEAWENHILRNKSIVVDLFHGQLKSKVTCKVCSHESVRFDPFTFLSLPLPMESSIHLEVIVIRQDGSTPIKYGLTLDMESRFSGIKPHLARICRIPPHNLILVDIVSSQFRVIPVEEQKLKGMNGSTIFAYEFDSSTNPLKLSRLHVGSVSGGAGSNTSSHTEKSFSDIQRNSRARNSLQSTNTKTAIKPGSGQNVSSDGSNTTTKQEKVSSSCTSVGHNNSSKDEGWEAGKGNKKWSNNICMNGLCFKKKDPSSSTTDKDEIGDSSSSEPQSLPTTLNVPDKSDKAALIPNGGPSSLNSSSSPHHLSVRGHSREGSTASSVHSFENGPAGPEVADCHQGVIAALHRKMLPQEVYFLSVEKYRPSLFGIPLIVPCNEATTFQDLYRSVWVQVSRLVSPLPPRDSSSSQNHATDCDDSLKYEYPFELKLVTKDGSWCSRCPWHRFCRGCSLPCSNDLFDFASSNLAIDWDQTALHLRYLSAQERAFKEDPSVGESQRAASEPITLKKCLEAFTREEELGEDEKYYCSSCKTLQLAVKKLQIWRLPPILIIHLKRFHYLNNRWIKSHKIVDFPSHNLDPTDYLAAVPATTLKRYQSIKKRTAAMANGTIAEMSEPNSLTSLEKIEFEDAIMDGDGANVFDDDDDDDDAAVSANTFGNPSEVFSPSFGRRKRQESTSLVSHPVKDDNLQDFHQHKLIGGIDALDVKYNLYSMVCHSGVLGGGHYVSYGKNEKGKWFCQNDSTCKEIPADQIDKSTAYMLFYEREDLNFEEYLPDITEKNAPDTKDLDEELETDFKKQCSIM